MIDDNITIQGVHLNLSSSISNPESGETIAFVYKSAIDSLWFGRGHRKNTDIIGRIDFSIKGFDQKVSRGLLREKDFDITVYGLKGAAGFGVFIESDLDLSIHRMSSARTGNVAHTDFSIDIFDNKMTDQMTDFDINSMSCPLPKMEKGIRIGMIAELITIDLLEWYLPWHEQVYLPWYQGQQSAAGGSE